MVLVIITVFPEGFEKEYEGHKKGEVEEYLKILYLSIVIMIPVPKLSILTVLMSILVC